VTIIIRDRKRKSADGCDLRSGNGTKVISFVATFDESHKLSETPLISQSALARQSRWSAGAPLEQLTSKR
jgi:hypothetical protein